MNHELKKHKKNDGVKWVLTLFAVILLAVAVTAAITKGFRNWNPYGWFDKQEEKTEQPFSGVTDVNGKELHSDTVYSMRSLVFAQTTAESQTASNGITLKATVSPAYATNPNVDWVVEFVDGAAAWINPDSYHQMQEPDKTVSFPRVVTEYITVTPAADGSDTATVRYIRPFAVQIKVTAVSRANKNLKAVCTVDCGNKFAGCAFQWFESSACINFNEGNTFYFNGDSRATVKFNVIDPNVSHEVARDNPDYWYVPLTEMITESWHTKSSPFIISGTVTLTDEFKALFKQDSLITGGAVTFSSEFGHTYLNFNTVGFWELFLNETVAINDSRLLALKGEISKAIVQAQAQNIPMLKFAMVYKNAYSETHIDRFADISLDTIEVPVDNVTIEDSDNIVL